MFAVAILSFTVATGNKNLPLICVFALPFTVVRWNLLIYIYVYIHGFRTLKNVVCKLGDWYVVDQTLAYLGPYRSKSDWSRSFSRFMDLSDVVYIIWTLKPLNDLRPANEMAFLVLAAGCTFGGHLSIWTIYDLKQQSWKLAPWNMHGPTVICCSNAFSWFFLINMNQKRKGTRLLSGHLRSD